MYRENISNFVKETRARLFIPKNRGLNVYVRSLLPEIGVTLEEKMDEIEKIAKDDAAIQSFEEDKAIETIWERAFKIDFVRGEDIPQLVEDFVCRGEAAYGLTGDDLFDEYALKKAWNGGRNPLVVLNTYDWFDETAMYRRPALCLMNRSGNISDLPEKPRIAVNRKYEFISNGFIDDRIYPLKKLPSINVYNGGTEQTVDDGINDCCIDIVYSGRSLEENKLKVVDIARFSDIVLIGENPNDMGNAFCEDYRQIMERKGMPKEGSATTDLLRDRKKRRNKMVEEMVEMTEAMSTGRLKEEIPDVLYMLNVVMAAEGINPRDVADEIYGRMKR